MRAGQRVAMVKLHFLLGMILVSVFDLSGLNPNFRITQYGRAVYNETEGLPQNSVHAVCQTEDGYIWFGTEEGLVRFDGARFRVFNRRNTPVFRSNYIHCLMEDRKGRLWIGSKEGLFRYRDRQFHRISGNGLPEDLFVYDLEEDSDGGVWVASDGKGLFHLQGGRVRHLTMAQGLWSNVVRCIDRTAPDRLIAGTADGMNRIVAGRILPVKESGEALRGRNIYRVVVDVDGVLWAGTDEGLYSFTADRWLSRKLPSTLHTRIVTDLLVDKDGSLWIGTAGGGLVRRSHDSDRGPIAGESGLSDLWINRLYEDREGSLWVGTAFRGVNLLHEVKVMTRSVREGLPDDVVFCVFQDSRGRVWAGTNNGLARIDGWDVRVITTAEGLSNNTVNSISEDGEGGLWAGTDDGLNRLVINGSGSVTCERFLSGHMFLASMVDSRNILWVASNRGVYRFDGGNFTPVDRERLHGLRVANFFFEDREGSIWISAYRTGLIRKNSGGIRLFTEKDGLVDSAVMCIHQDREGIMWVGTTGGLSVFDGQIFRSIGMREGLFSDTIYRILEDGGGGLWLSCNRGLFRIMKRDVADVLDGVKATLSCVVLGKSDGMRSHECNGGIQPAGWRTGDGRLWFPTMKGVSILDPQNMWRNSTPPPVVIGDIRLDGRSIEPEKSFRVDAGIKRLEFRFSALSYIGIDRITYRYRLQGFDEEWIDGGQHREAFYTNLPPGDYLFQIKAMNADGVWSVSPASVDFAVIPPFWRTWWFILLALVLFALASYWVINFLQRYIRLAAFWKKEKYVGHFQVLDKIASGGMGTIYKAKDLLDNSRIVAVKILRDEYFENEDMKRRFAQEAEIIHRLRHPHIIRVLERGEVKKTQYIAMEYLRGETLSRLLARESRLETASAIHIVHQVGEALAFIHEKNIIHRDLKPENIMLVHRGRDRYFVKLLDFGLARTQFQTRITQTGMVLGTIHYLSPEQVRESLSSRASDIYSLGIIFYEMVTARKPFPGDSTVTVMKRILEEVPREPVRWNPGIPPEVNRLIMEMVAKDPSARPTIDQVMERLHNP